MLTVVLICVALVALITIRATSRRKPGQRLTLRDRLISSLTPAMVGAGLGFAYARYTMDPEALTGSSVPAMYASLGAVLGILTIRVGTLVVLMYRDFFGGGDDG